MSHPKPSWEPTVHRLDRALAREPSEQDRAKAARAYDQFERGEIDGVLLTRLPSGRWGIKRMPRIIED